MAGASDKVRFYMEQAVPQLREFEEKKIFTKVRTPRTDQSTERFLHPTLCLLPLLHPASDLN